MPEENNEQNAYLNCMGYDYKVKLLINGLDPGITGGMSESKRIFFKDSKSFGDMPEEMKNQFMLLNHGENEISVEYKKTSERPSNVSIEITMEQFPVPHFYLFSEEKEGKLTAKFEIKEKYDENLKPIVSINNDDKKSGFIYLGTMGCSIGGTLNETRQPFNAMMGTMPLLGIKDGQNKLEIVYQGDPAQAKEIKFAIATPEWAKVFTREIKDKEQKTETLEFQA